MGTVLNSNIVNSYLALFKSLSPHAKRDLISRLTQSLERDLKPESNLFDSAFGAWQGDETAEQLISEIRDSRNFNRQIEGL